MTSVLSVRHGRLVRDEDVDGDGRAEGVEKLFFLCHPERSEGSQLFEIKRFFPRQWFDFAHHKRRGRNDKFVFSEFFDRFRASITNEKFILDLRRKPFIISENSALCYMFWSIL